MDAPVAVVKEIDGRRALVEAEAAVCARCRAGQGCGAGIFSGRARRTALTVTLADDLEVAPGDRVLLRMTSGGLLRGTGLLYGLPLGGLLAGALVSDWTALPDGGAAVLAAAGLLAGLLAGGRLAHRPACLSRLRPVAQRLVECPAICAGDAP